VALVADGGILHHTISTLHSLTASLCDNTGKTHVALGLGLAACQKGLSVGFTTAAALVSEMMEARDERRLLRFQKQARNCCLS
jgi:urocanate hydratase